jgi:hypothetical protein
MICGFKLIHYLLDFSAHSNYTELALKELGVDVFPHVGKQTEINVKGKNIFPVVTGTFGMTDFLHSVVGELGDKVTQSEVEDMESKLNQATQDDQQNDHVSVLKELLDKVPWDLLEGDDKPDPSKADELKQAAVAKTEETKQNPLDSNVTLGGVNVEEAKQMAQQTLKDMYPILQFHDQVMKGLTKIMSKVPGLDDLVENMMGALQIFAFSLLAPYIKPIIAQARVELKSSSEGVLKSSMKGQYEVFENESCSDPTHSMLSKDHFSNVLNPVAGQVACATVRFVVPHIVESWSDEGKDVRQVIDDILQVFHHPALRDEQKQGQKAMFETVKNWWESKSDTDKQHFTEILSRDGVKEGKNHEGEDDGHGHGHGAPVKKKQESNTSVPSAQEGADAISGIVGGLTNLVMKKSGLAEKFGMSQSSGSEQQQQPSRTENNSFEGRQGQGQQQSTQGSSYGRSEETSYKQETAGRLSGRGNNDEQSSYGRDSTQNESSYGRKTNTQNESSYGRKTDTYGESGNDRNDRFSGRGGKSSREDNEESSYGGGGNTYGGSGRENVSSYGGREERESGGREESGYGGREQRGHGGREERGYGGGREEGEFGGREERGYGGREERESGGREERGYGGRQERGGYGDRE